MKPPLLLTQADCRACHAGTWLLLVAIGLLAGWVAGQRERRVDALERGQARLSQRLALLEADQRDGRAEQDDAARQALWRDARACRHPAAAP